MEDLIKALQIFMKYGNSAYPCHCEHDVLYICVIKNKEDVSEEDLTELDKLGFRWDEEYGCFASFKFGSC